MIKTIPISKIIKNSDNPRVIKDSKFKKLVKSIQEFPEMLNIRPIVINSDNVILGGNQRLEAAKKAGLKEIPVYFAEELNEEQQKEFIIKDNVGYGDWDWEILDTGWDKENLGDWGLDIPVFNDTKFDPFLTPQTQHTDVTPEDIEKEAMNLASQMLKSKESRNCICPECGYEFSIDGSI